MGGSQKPQTPLRNIKMAPYVVNVKSTVKILSIFVAFLENMNFKKTSGKITRHVYWSALGLEHAKKLSCKLGSRVCKRSGTRKKTLIK